ncbi:MAG: hypothetical protein ABIY40_00230, partial [Rhodanobacteraceae bacterium]
GKATRQDEEFGVETLFRKPVFKQYRGADGFFYFKLLDGDGTELFISNGFESGQVAAAEKNRLALSAADEAISELSENFVAAQVSGGYRFEIRDPDGNLMFGTGPVVASIEESRSLRNRFLQAIESVAI